MVSLTLDKGIFPLLDMNLLTFSIFFSISFFPILGLHSFSLTDKPIAIACLRLVIGFLSRLKSFFFSNFFLYLLIVIFLQFS